MSGPQPLDVERQDLPVRLPVDVSTERESSMEEAKAICDPSDIA